MIGLSIVAGVVAAEMVGAIESEKRFEASIADLPSEVRQRLRQKRPEEAERRLAEARARREAAERENRRREVILFAFLIGAALF